MNGQFQYGGIPGVVVNNDPAGAAADALAIGVLFGRAVLAPLGNGNDDWSRFGPVASECADNGYDLHFLGQSYACDTEQEMRPDTRLYLNGATIRYDLTAHVPGVIETGDPFYCSGGHTTAAVANLVVVGIVGDNHITVDAALSIVAEDMIWLRKPAGSARAATFRVISKADAIVMTGTPQLSGLTLTGANASNTNNGTLYVDITKPAAVPVVNVYKDVAKTQLVATGTRADDLGGSIPLVPVGGSGLSAALTITAVVVPDTTGNFFYAGGRLTLDAPLDYPFPLATTVTVLPTSDQCRNIVLDGGGATVQPRTIGDVCDRTVEFVAAIDCKVEGINVNSSGVRSEATFGFDLGSVRSEFTRIACFAHNTGSPSFSIESSRDCKIRQCYSCETNGANYLVMASTNWLIENSSADLGSIGVSLQSVSADDAYGSRRGLLHGGAFRGCGVGIQCNDGSSYNRVVGTTIENSTYYAVELGATGGAGSGAISHDNEFHAVNVRGGAYAYYCFNGSYGNKIIGGSIEDCSNVSVIASGAGSEVRFFGVNVINRDVSGNIVAMFQAQSGGYLYIGSGSTITTTHATNHPAGVHVNTGASVDIDGLKTTMTAVGYGIIVEGANSVCRIGDYTQIGGEEALYLSGNTATISVLGRLRLVGVTLPFSLNAGATQAQSNVGTFQTDGAGAGLIAFTQVTANSTVRLYDNVTGLEVSSAPTITPGVSVAWAGLAAAHRYYAQIL